MAGPIFPPKGVSFDLDFWFFGTCCIISQKVIVGGKS
jgi:hypothetical protein